jgi:hypothetical protein
MIAEFILSFLLGFIVGIVILFFVTIIFSKKQEKDKQFSVSDHLKERKPDGN